MGSLSIPADLHQVNEKYFFPWIILVKETQIHTNGYDKYIHISGVDVDLKDSNFWKALTQKVKQLLAEVL